MARARGEAEPIPAGDHRQAAVAPSWRRASSTPTGCPTTSVLDRCSTTTSSTTRAATSWSRAGYDAELVERVIRLVDTAEYKRRQYPPGPKVTSKGFGRDRRLPDHQPLARTTD